jgi:serine/threonine-protein kinase HipA
MPLHCCKRWGVTPGAVQLLGEDEEPLGFDQIEGTPLTDPEVYQLTPLYDVLSFWPVAGGAANNIQTHKAKMAMAVWGKSRHYNLRGIQRRHYNAMAAKCGLGADVEDLLQPIIESTPGVIAQVSAELPPGFPNEVAESTLRGLENAARRLVQMPSH